MKPQARTDVKQMLKEGDDVELPMDPEYYHRLHAKIMAKIDPKVSDEMPMNLKIDPVAAMKKSFFLRR